jgi:hypothetical protein
MELRNQYRILTNRKRSIIALAHSVIFLMIAWRGMVSAKTVDPIWTRNAAAVSSIVMLFIYLVVSTVLIHLARISRCMREKLYFWFCASSATFGLLRTVIGDPALHAALYLRVAMLICAVVTGTLILREYSRAGRIAETQCEASLESV